jgi:hypothetical protein
MGRITFAVLKFFAVSTRPNTTNAFGRMAQWCQPPASEWAGRSGAKFPVFPVEPGISSICPPQPPFGRENSEINQSLEGEFP